MVLSRTVFVTEFKIFYLYNIIFICLVFLMNLMYHFLFFIEKVCINKYFFVRKESNQINVFHRCKELLSFFLFFTNCEFRYLFKVFCCFLLKCKACFYLAFPFFLPSRFYLYRKKKKRRRMIV